MSDPDPAHPGERPVRVAPLGEFVLYFLGLGTTGFGGPIALTGYMQRELVERRRWVSEQDYKEGLSLAPDPVLIALAGVGGLLLRVPAA